MLKGRATTWEPWQLAYALLLLNPLSMLCRMSVCLQRYLYYINNGVDTEHVAPLEDSWISNILARVGSTDPAGNSLVTKFSGGVEFLSDEVREEYLLSVKKSIGQCTREKDTVSYMEPD